MQVAEREAKVEVKAALVRLGLAHPGQKLRFERLTGGVSSDIWRVELGRGPVCVKRALAKLRVWQDWFAPVERNAYEAAWMRRAAAVVPEAVPELLGQDGAAGVLVMAYLDPARHRPWKAEFRDGRAEVEVARAVGERLVGGYGDTIRNYSATGVVKALRSDEGARRRPPEPRL
jgi:5-methylthioribose kinase